MNQLNLKTTKTVYYGDEKVNGTVTLSIINGSDICSTSKLVLVISPTMAINKGDILSSQDYFNLAENLVFNKSLNTCCTKPSSDNKENNFEFSIDFSKLSFIPSFKEVEKTNDQSIEYTLFAKLVGQDTRTFYLGSTPVSIIVKQGSATAP